MTVELDAFAKLNLELRVLGRRPDGSHDIETVMQAVSLSDRLTIDPAPESRLAAIGFPVPAGPDNLVLRAAAAAGAAARFALFKRIPSGAGLGGGSSDAAAVLRWAGKGREDLSELALALGADVPFFLRGGRARATGLGEQLAALPDLEQWYAIAWPGFEIPTGAVYRAWDQVGGDGPNHLYRAACAVEPELAQFARDLGPGWQMTGSGSAFFLPVAGEKEGRRAVAGQRCWTAVVRSVPAWA
ncbi:MAG: 4-(cytidine 5'-diphospho)-2-C-methyl-D-erythritol kinase [Candidatus Dormibacteraceae bacterium]